MIAIAVVGWILTIVAGPIAFVAVRMLWHAQNVLADNGIKEPLAIDRKARFIVLGWIAAFSVGIVFLIVAYV